MVSAACRVVNEFAVPFEAARSAIDASAVMENAAIYSSVAEAVADCTLVVGTTAVGERDLQHPLLTLAQAAPAMRTELQQSPVLAAQSTIELASQVRRVALLFGSEKTGLSNEELSHCNWLLTIPMYQHEGIRHPSMNLGQAVAVCLYELVREQEEPDHMNKDAPSLSPPTSSPAEAATLERMTALLIEVMDKTEYTRRHAANSSAENVRRLVRRMGADANDAAAWAGILRQILWSLSTHES